MLTSYFSGEAPAQRGDVLLMRGTEGETVANAKRALVAQFARNLSLALGGEEPSGADKEISGLKLAWLALRARAGK